jgi:NAD(P)-dependent dehydrogenase (short-subunit alcohol dehydrogenase family)
VRRLSRDGSVVVFAGRRSDRGHVLAGDIEQVGGRAEFYRADVTKEGDVAGLVEHVVSRHGRLDGAFNNAGNVVAASPLHDLSESSWRSELDVGLTSVFLGLKHQVPAILQTAGAGSIVNNASIAGVVGVQGLAAYAAAKHGVIGLTRAAALEYAGRNVRVNALVTGNVDTPLFRRLLGASETDELSGEGLNPTGRVAAPDEIAALVGFLLGDDAAFITGAAVAIDGGFTAG